MPPTIPNASHPVSLLPSSDQLSLDVAQQHRAGTHLQSGSRSCLTLLPLYHLSLFQQQSVLFLLFPSPFLFAITTVLCYGITSFPFSCLSLCSGEDEGCLVLWEGRWNQGKFYHLSEQRSASSPHESHCCLKGSLEAPSSEPLSLGPHEWVRRHLSQMLRQHLSQVCYHASICFPTSNGLLMLSISFVSSYILFILMNL